MESHITENGQVARQTNIAQNELFKKNMNTIDELINTNKTKELILIQELCQEM